MRRATFALFCTAFASVASTALIGCADPGNKIIFVSGARYCIPARNITPSVLGINSGLQTNEVAFKLERSDLALYKILSTKTAILMGVFSERRQDVFSPGGPLPGSHYYENLRQPSVSPDIVFGGKLLYVYEYPDRKNFQVWSQEERSTLAGSTVPLPDRFTLLLAVCSRMTNDFIRKNGAEISCSRTFHSNIGSIHYTAYIAEFDLPHISGLDPMVMQVVRGWQCNAA